MHAGGREGVGTNYILLYLALSEAEVSVVIIQGSKSELEIIGVCRTCLNGALSLNVSKDFIIQHPRGKFIDCL